MYTRLISAALIYHAHYLQKLAYSYVSHGYAVSTHV